MQNDRFEWWYPDPDCEIPKRTVLSSLPPIGLDTGYVESLSSYFFRLANLHHLSPRTLAEYLIIPHLLTLKIKKEAANWLTSNFNGIGKSSDEWASQLELLTDQNRIKELTLISLKSLLPAKKLLSQIKKWCPRCIEDSSQNGAGYGQLLWEIDDVKACPIHRIRLVDKCICKNDSPNFSSKRKHLPELCFKCGRNLAESTKKFISPTSTFDYERAIIAMEMIKDRKIIENSVVDRSGVSVFLSGIIQSHFNGIALNLANTLGVTKNILSGWVNDRHLPILTNIIGIAQACNCKVSDIFCGNFKKVERLKSIASQKSKYRPRIVTKSKQYINTKEFRKELIVTIRNNPILSLKQIATKLNTHSKTIKRHHKKIANQVVLRHKKYQQSCKKILFARNYNKINHAVEAIVKRGEKPTFRRINEELNGEIALFRDKYREAVKQIINNYLSKKNIK